MSLSDDALKKKTIKGLTLLVKPSKGQVSPRIFKNINLKKEN